MNAQSEESFLGGLRWRGRFALWPSVRMVITSRHLELRPATSILRSIFRNRELKLDSVVAAERIARVGPFPAPGVRLRQSEAPAIIFWTLRPRSVLAALQQRGVAVTFAGRPAPFWGTERSPGTTMRRLD